MQQKLSSKEKLVPHVSTLSTMEDFRKQQQLTKMMKRQSETDHANSQQNLKVTTATQES